MTLSDWSPDDFAANRRGELTANQIAKLRARGRAVQVSSIVIMAVMVAGFSYLMIGRGDLALHIVGIVFDLMVLGFGGYALMTMRRTYAQDLAGGSVVSRTGLVKVAMKISGRQKGKHEVLTVGGEDVRALYGGLDKLDGETVTVYMLPHSKLVFALERGAA